MFLSEHNFLGLEYDWIGVDSDGLIGYFSTAGVGSIPKVCITFNLFDGVFEEIKSLDKTSSVSQTSGFDKNCEDWLMVASKGFYGFDWSRELSKYVLIAIPEIPYLFKGGSKKLDEEIDLIHLDVSFTKKLGLPDLIEF